MSAHSNRAHVIRAALESIGYQLRDVLDMMKSLAGVDVKTIRADGGATRNRFLMQFIADMARLNVTAAPIAECSPLGAAMAGALGMGHYKSLDDVAAVPRVDATTYEPKMPADQADRFHGGWKRAVTQVLAGAAP
jgi:glycerol kinase